MDATRRSLGRGDGDWVVPGAARGHRSAPGHSSTRRRTRPGRDGAPARSRGPLLGQRRRAVVARHGLHGDAPRRVSRGIRRPYSPNVHFLSFDQAKLPRRQLGAHKRAKAHLAASGTRSPPSPSQGAPMDEQSTPADVESGRCSGAARSGAGGRATGRRRMCNRDARGRRWRGGRSDVAPSAGPPPRGHKKRALRQVLAGAHDGQHDLVQPPKGAKPLEMATSASGLLWHLRKPIWTRPRKRCGGVIT